MKTYYIYIMTNKSNSVLYTGVTSSLRRRVEEHKEKRADGFTKRYNITKLVYFESFTEVQYALQREKQIKAGTRQKKLDLVNAVNQEWKDLSDQIPIT